MRLVQLFWFLMMMLLLANCSMNNKNIAKGCRMDDILIEDKHGQLRCGKLYGAVGQYTIEIKKTNQLKNIGGRMEKEVIEEKTGRIDVIALMKDPNRFENLKDGWVRDHFLGIDWGKSSKGLLNLSDAQEFCSKMGGRLPTVDELRLLVDHSKFEPAINSEFFVDTKTDDWYWTGTRHPKLADYAWCVYFDGGFVSYSHEGDANYVRPVRASQ